MQCVFKAFSAHKQVFGYYASGSESESTLRDNRAAFSRYRLIPRMMVDVSNVDTTCTLLGEHTHHCVTLQVSPCALYFLPALRTHTVQQKHRLSHL